MSEQAASVSRPAARAAVVWGVVVGLLQAATPLAFWWLDSATVYALGLVGIAFVYVGFAVAGGRPKVIAVREQRHLRLRRRGRRGRNRIAVAARGRSRRARAQGPLAAPKPFRRKSAMVAAVLHGRRLGRRRDHRRRDRCGHALRPSTHSRRRWPLKSTDVHDHDRRSRR